MDSKEGNCENCGVQLSLQEDFDSIGDISLQVKRLELLKDRCLNCADNSHLRGHNWSRITKAQRAKLILKHAPKEAHKRLLAKLQEEE